VFNDDYKFNLFASLFVLPGQVKEWNYHEKACGRHRLVVEKKQYFFF
jgi:hypothetical protein